MAPEACHHGKEPQTPLGEGWGNQRMSPSRVNAFLIYSENALYVENMNPLPLSSTYCSHAGLCGSLPGGQRSLLTRVTPVAPLPYSTLV